MCYFLLHQLTLGVFDPVEVSSLRSGWKHGVKHVKKKHKNRSLRFFHRCLKNGLFSDTTTIWIPRNPGPESRRLSPLTLTPLMVPRAGSLHWWVYKDSSIDIMGISWFWWYFPWNKPSIRGTPMTGWKAPNDDYGLQGFLYWILKKSPGNRQDIKPGYRA